MIDFLLSLPLWALAVVLNAWLIGFVLTGLWALRRWILPRLRIDTNASLFLAAAVMQSGMVLYGLVAALTAVSVWTTHSHVADTVSQEATAIATLGALRRHSQRERDAMQSCAAIPTRYEEENTSTTAGRVPGAEWLNVSRHSSSRSEPASVTEDPACSDAGRLRRHD
jgi:hypothetical protein